VRQSRSVLAAAALVVPAVALVAPAVALVAPAMAGGPDSGITMPALAFHASTVSTTEFADASVRGRHQLWPDQVVMVLVGTALIGLGGVVRRPPSRAAPSEPQPEPPIAIRTWTRP
jgi:hypothetical protein